MLFILAVGRPPFVRATQVNHHYKHIYLGSWADFWRVENVDLPLELKDLLWKMLAYLPSERLSIKEIREHPWMTGDIAIVEEVEDFLLKRK